MKHFLFIILALFFAKPGFGQEIDLKLELYVDQVLSLKDNDGTLTYPGKNLEQIKNGLTEQGFSVEVIILPWARLLREAEKSDNSLIFNILRTSERETNYHWIALLERVEYFLYGLKTPKENLPLKEAVLDGPSQAVCEIGAAHCEWLKEFGFQSEQIIEVHSYPDFSPERLVLRGRADYFLDFPENVKIILERLNESPDALIPYYSFKQVSTYLVAPKSIDKTLLEKINAIMFNKQ